VAQKNSIDVYFCGGLGGAGVVWGGEVSSITVISLKGLDPLCVYGIQLQRWIPSTCTQL
jgi:hypothetical protein